MKVLTAETLSPLMRPHKIVSRCVVYLALASALSGKGRVGQMTIAGNPTRLSSLRAAMVSRVMYRARWTAHSSFCSNKIAPTSRTIASSLGKIPTTSVRRLISPLSRSRPLVEWIFDQWSAGKSI